MGQRLEGSLAGSELGSAKRHYENCQISIKYRVIARKDGFEQFQRVIGQDEYDVFYFIDFIRSTASRFHPVEPLVLPDDYQSSPSSKRYLHRWLGGRNINESAFSPILVFSSMDSTHR